MFVLCNAGPGRMARMDHASDIFRQAAAEAVAGYNSASSTEEKKRWRIGPRQVTLSKTDVHRWILTVSRRHQSRSKAASVCAINLDICGYDSRLPQLLVWSRMAACIWSACIVASRRAPVRLSMSAAKGIGRFGGTVCVVCKCVRNTSGIS